MSVTIQTAEALLITNRIYLFLLLYSLNSLNQTDKFSPVSFIIMIQSLFSQTDYFVISSLTLEIRIPDYCPNIATADAKRKSEDTLLPLLSTKGSSIFLLTSLSGAL